MEDVPIGIFQVARGRGLVPKMESNLTHVNGTAIKETAYSQEQQTPGSLGIEPLGEPLRVIQQCRL